MNITHQFHRQPYFFSVGLLAIVLEWLSKIIGQTYIVLDELSFRKEIVCNMNMHTCTTYNKPATARKETTQETINLPRSELVYYASSHALNMHSCH